MSLNSYNLTKQSVVYGMFNQFVFNEVKTNIDLIERYFLMDVTTMGNNLIKSLLDAVRKYEFQNIDEPLFRSILASQGKTDSESSSILNEIIKYKMFDTYQIDPIRKFIRGIGSQSLLDIAAKKFAGDPEGYIKYLRTNEYKADYSDMFSVTNFDNIDINAIQASSMGGWKSAFDFMNQSFQPMQKYENGQIVMVCMPPGCFTGDTKVRLSDGTEISMKDLKEGIESGNEYYTFCRSETGEVKVTKIKDCWITKKTDDLVDVKIDNGALVRCTPDHKFMMRDGSYKEAKDLKPQDSLMSDWIKSEYNLKELYEHKDDYLDFLHLKGYLIYKITNKVNGKCYIGDTDVDLMWRLFDHPFGAHLSIRYNNSYSHLYNAMRKYKLENFTIRIVYRGEETEYHNEGKYIQFYDSYNNGYNGSSTGKWAGDSRTKGLIRIIDPTGTIEKRVRESSFREFWSLHGWIKGVKKSSVESWRSSITKNKGIKGRIIINNSKIEKRVKPSDLEYWLNNPDETWIIGRLPSVSEKRNEKMKSENKGFYDRKISSAAGKKSAELSRINGTNLYDPEIRKCGQINGLKSQKENGTGIYDPKVRKLANESSQATLRSKKIGACHDPKIQSQIRRLATEKAKEKRLTNNFSIMDEMISEGLPITKLEFESRRKLYPKSSSSTLKWDKMIERMSLDQKIKYGLDNHKVASVIKVNSNIVPVYDLEVEDESHNFLLADGEVFVHNCGKTLFMINECLNMCIQGARCHYLALGDMNQKDFVQRMGAIYSGLNFGDVMLNLPNVFSQLKNIMRGKFNLTILPAAQTSVDEYIEYMLAHQNEYDVLFVDYDSNFKPTQADNMYKEGGYIYDNLTKLTKAGKLVFCASQPKIGSWRNETIELTDAGESSRKQHNVDVMITGSRGGMTYNPNHLGRMKIAKNRRGEEGVEVPYIRLNNGRFRILTETLYSKLKGIAERRNYTDSDINQMLEMEQQAMMSQSNQVHQQQSSHNNPQQNSQSNNQQFDLQAYMASQLNSKP